MKFAAIFFSAVLPLVGLCYAVQDYARGHAEALPVEAAQPVESRPVPEPTVCPPRVVTTPPRQIVPPPIVQPPVEPPVEPAIPEFRGG
jgi:hypothetical protein